MSTTISTGQTETEYACWNCDEPVGGEAECGACGALQPVRGTVDYFAVLGAKERMNPELEALRDRFYDLSRKFHPDYFQQKSSFERECAEEWSALVNRAWRTLSDDDQRLEHILERHDILPKEQDAADNGGGERAQMDPEFLMEMMELQEEIQEAREAEDPAQLEGPKTQLATRVNDLQQRMAAAMQRWDADEDKAPVGEELKRLIGERNYYRRLLRTIEEIEGDV